MIGYYQLVVTIVNNKEPQTASQLSTITIMTAVIKLTVNTQMQTYYNLTAAKIDDIKDTNGAFFSFTASQ
jgi:hypothetical protein